MARFFVLNDEERMELFRQDKDTKGDGGFQGLLVRLQEKYRPGTQEIKVDDKDIDDMQRMAFDSGKGGWELRLLKMFSRHRFLPDVRPLDLRQRHLACHNLSK